MQELKARESFVGQAQLQAPLSVESPLEHVRQSHVAEHDVPNPLLEVQDGLFAGQDSAQPVFIGEASCTAFGDRLLQCVDGSYNSVTCNTIPDHITHPAFNRLASRDFQLPNRVQATLLVRRAHSFIGNNYHLFEKKSFFEKLDRAYSAEGSPDLLFMCHLFAMLALGELYSHCKTNAADARVPGTSYFVQAVNLLQDLYEVGSIEQVQILLLLVSIAKSIAEVLLTHISVILRQRSRPCQVIPCLLRHCPPHWNRSWSPSIARRLQYNVTCSTRDSSSSVVDTLPL